MRRYSSVRPQLTASQRASGHQGFTGRSRQTSSTDDSPNDPRMNNLKHGFSSPVALKLKHCPASLRPGPVDAAEVPRWQDLLLSAHGTSKAASSALSGFRGGSFLGHAVPCHAVPCTFIDLMSVGEALRDVFCRTRLGRAWAVLQLARCRVRFRGTMRVR